MSFKNFICIIISFQIKRHSITRVIPDASTCSKALPRASVLLCFMTRGWGRLETRPQVPEIWLTLVFSKFLLLLLMLTIHKYSPIKFVVAAFPIFIQNKVSDRRRQMTRNKAVSVLFGWGQRFWEIRSLLVNGIVTASSHALWHVL